jgi:hypothetical protein
MLTAYLDESYNSRTFCVAGWILPEKRWTPFDRDWRKRIDQERQQSIRAGFKPISRYHASDCSNLKNEFDPSQGWDVDRQIKLSKRLLGIVIKHMPIGVVVGGSIDVFLNYFTDDKTRWRKALYYFSVSVVLAELAQIAIAGFPGERITVFYDHGKLSSMAGKAFQSMKEDPRNADISPLLVTMAPLGWEDCALLQPIDLLAFEGMKRVDGHLNGNDTIRKSFAALLGKKVDIAVGSFTDEYYQALQKSKLEEISNALRQEDADEDES